MGCSESRTVVPAVGVAVAVGGGFSETTDIHTRGGKSFEIELEGNPTTGYEWKLQPHDDDPHVKFLGEEYQQQQQQNSVGGGPMIVGAGGVFKFRFMVDASCPAGYNKQLHFAYKRSWESVAVETRIYRIICE